MALSIAHLSSAAPCSALQNEKVLLIVNEANQNVYLSGRNVATLAINTANAVQVSGGLVRWELG